MGTLVLVGTIDLFRVSDELRSDLLSVRESIKSLVNAKPFGEHSEQDLNDYLDLRRQEELLVLQLS